MINIINKMHQLVGNMKPVKQTITEPIFFPQNLGSVLK